MMYSVSDRTLSIARATAMAVALCFGAAALAMAADESTPNTPAMTPVPATQSPAKGEFDNSCTMGLASGQVVKTDCSVNWTSPDGKTYCFSSNESKEAFLKNPQENIQKAREFTRMAPLPAKTAYQQGYALLRKPNIADAIAELIQERCKPRSLPTGCFRSLPAWPSPISTISCGSGTMATPISTSPT
jgi:YHS domain-containing protein